MINLAPENFKKELIADYRLRVVVVFSSLLLIVLLIGLVLLSSFYLVLIVQGRSLDNLLSAQGYNQAGFVGMERELKESKTQVDIVNKNLTNSLLPSYIIEEISLIQPPVVRISNIILEPQGEGRVSVTINGLSETRSGLILFIDNLRGHLAIADLNAPISSLINETNSTFSFSMMFSY